MCSRRRSATTAYATSAAAIPIGGLISSTQRQLSVSVMTPPSSVPAAPPAPFIAAHRPIARCSCGPGGNDEVMIASEDAAISAQLKPWTPRAVISSPLLGAKPPASDVIENSTSAATNTRLWPKWSAARPPSIRKLANVIAYASTTHCRSAEEKLRLDWIDGSATLTMLRSRITMNCATQQTTRIQVVRGERPVGASPACPASLVGGASTVISSSGVRQPCSLPLRSCPGTRAIVEGGGECIGAVGAPWPLRRLRTFVV